MLFWQWAFFQFKNHFNGFKDHQIIVSSLKTKLARSDVRNEVIQYQFDLFKQQVARIFPDLKADTPFDLREEARSLASVIQQPSEEILMLAQYETTVDELKKMFEKNQFKEVIRKSKNMLALHPVTPSIVTVYFMLAESYYQTNELDSCLEIAQQMIKLFPEEDKTGYVLLRVGLFLKEKNRIEEARNMFSLVNHAFSHQKELKKQSKRLLASIAGGE